MLLDFVTYFWLTFFSNFKFIQDKVEFEVSVVKTSINYNLVSFCTFEANNPIFHIIHLFIVFVWHFFFIVKLSGK